MQAQDALMHPAHGEQKKGSEKKGLEICIVIASQDIALQGWLYKLARRYRACNGDMLLHTAVVPHGWMLPATGRSKGFLLLLIDSKEDEALAHVLHELLPNVRIVFLGGREDESADSRQRRLCCKLSYSELKQLLESIRGQMESGT